MIEKPTLEEQVVWDDAIYPSILLSLVACYGEGPFKIVGLRLHREEAQARCPYAVTIELRNKERKEFAGEWFKRAQ